MVIKTLLWCSSKSLSITLLPFNSANKNEIIFVSLVSDKQKNKKSEYVLCCFNHHTGVIEEKSLLFFTILVHAVASLLIRNQIMLSLAFTQLLSGLKGYRSTHTMALQKLEGPASHISSVPEAEKILLPSQSFFPPSVFWGSVRHKVSTCISNFGDWQFYSFSLSDS